MNEVFKSVLAGVCIGIAGTAYLNVGGLAGAVLFSFGLIVVVSLQLFLFTGMAYAVWGKGYAQLLTILIFNLIGCLAVAAVVSSPEITAYSTDIISNRLSQGPFSCGLLAIGCGFIMTTAVTMVKKHNNWWPLLFGVPTFIMCGFPHCIADAFYLMCCSRDYVGYNFLSILGFYGSIVLGNYLGCNLYRLTIISFNNNNGNS